MRYLEEEIYMLADDTQTKITVKIRLKLIYEIYDKIWFIKIYEMIYETYSGTKKESLIRDSIWKVKIIYKLKKCYRWAKFCFYLK